MNAVVDAVIQERPALAETRSRAELEALVEAFLTRLESDGRIAAQED